jgi:predicted nucleotidyltransferase
MNIHLQAQHLQTVTNILRKHDLLQFSAAFGSRVQGTHQEYSDLDILIRAPQALSLAQFSELDQSFAESDLPFKVDLVDWHKISDGFREKIRNYIVPFSER